LLKREKSAQPSNEELESYRGEDEGVMSNEEDEGEERERVTGTIMTVVRIIVMRRP